MTEHGVTEIVVNATGVEQPSAISLRDADTWHSMFGGNKTTDAGVKVNHRTMIGFPPFWRGVNLLASGLSGLPLDVFRRDGDDRKPARTHRARRLLRKRANPVTDACVFQETMMGHALLFGNGYAIIERDSSFKPEWLWPLDPQNMMVRFVDGELWYATTIDGQPVKFPGRDIFHLKGLTHNGVQGYSAADIFSEALGLPLAAQKFGAKFFGSGTHSSGVLMVPGHFSDEKIRNTLNAWDKMQTGMKNAHKIALLQEGAKYQQMTTDPDSAQFLETRGYEVRVTVAGILGVPPHLLGDDTRQSHNALESEDQSFLTKSLNPWLRRYERECEFKLLTEREYENDTHFVEFNREAAVQMEFEKKIAGLYRLTEMGYFSVNDGLQKLNLPGIGPDGDRRFRPANWIGLGDDDVDEPGMQLQPDPDPTDDDPQAATLRALVESSVTDAIKIECRKVVAAAKKEENFCGWLDDFYLQFTAKTVGEMTTRSAIEAKVAYADESKRMLLEVAGSSTTSTLSANVSELVATWNERGAVLSDKLMESI